MHSLDLQLLLLLVLLERTEVERVDDLVVIGGLLRLLLSKDSLFL